ncbi:MAG: SUF system NifU family Fe-S cluster assembly protein [Alphaproteobacteria bacterium]|nr:SUF system NifU family Fe-S cluster assembly protein [Alphaproteobacteria bacterium]
MSDLRELYQDVILDHSKYPRNFGPLADANRDAHGDNPLCGDQVEVHLKVSEDGTVEDVQFEGRGCAISIASASLMTEILKGRSEDDARALFRRFQAFMTGEGELDGKDEALEKLEVFSGVRDLPMRVKCATLGWHTMNAALNEETETVVTE